MYTEKIFIGIQSRLASSRFPRKAFIDILGIPLIVRVIQRFKKFSLPHDLVLLCPHSDIEEFTNFLTSYNSLIPVFGGDSQNVLSRYYEISKKYKHQLIMRVTGDNPLISIPLAEQLVHYHHQNNPDLSHYIHNPLGTGVELITFDALSKCFSQAYTDFQREHITQFIYQNPEMFTIAEPISPYILPQHPHLSIDTPEDIHLIESLLLTNKEWDISLF